MLASCVNADEPLPKFHWNVISPISLVSYGKETFVKFTVSGPQPLVSVWVKLASGLGNVRTVCVTVSRQPCSLVPINRTVNTLSWVSDRTYTLLAFCVMAVAPLPRSQLKLIMPIEPVSFGVDWLVKLTVISPQPLDGVLMNSAVGNG